MNIHDLCFEQKYEKYQKFLSENFQFLVMKFSIYLNRHVFVMEKSNEHSQGLFSEKSNENNKLTIFG